MATSESDDFESADEELDNRSAPKKRISSQRVRAVVDSESDDDTECTSSPIQPSYRNNRTSKPKRRSDSRWPTEPEDNPRSTRSASPDKPSSDKPQVPLDPIIPETASSSLKHGTETQDSLAPSSDTNEPELPKASVSATDETNNGEKPGLAVASVVGNVETDEPVIQSVVKAKKDRVNKQQKQREARSTGSKKLGSKIGAEHVAPQLSSFEMQETSVKRVPGENKKPALIEQCWEELGDILSKPLSESKSGNLSKWDESWDDAVKPANVDDCWEGMDEEIEIPEELKSNKKFSEVFKSDGWEDMEEDVNIPEEMTEEKILPVLDKLSLAGEEQDKSGGWGWGAWGVSSLINTASAGVTTLTNHVTQGLTMLEESMGVPDPEELARIQTNEEIGQVDERTSPEGEVSDTQVHASFGFGNLMSGVSSITKLVESTSNKVIAGGLDTLETIGKKTMEVLQDGDPGLKKKRAFFTQDQDKPILSQMLREAKDKAETEEKTLEEKQLARKVHFESLFDDYQGLVHLEALEMLSKQCDIKIQQHMINLNADELCSMQETLEEVKELCDLGDEDDDEIHETDLQDRLKAACTDLGVNMTYDKLLETWNETKTYLSTVISTEPLPADREVFQRAISTLAQFTALAVERFHKTAELLLVKERRSTVNEADALVQFTNILSAEVGVMANLFADKLNERVKTSGKPEAISANITTIFLEAANASSYIQDAFKLLIPVLQVGAT